MLSGSSVASTSRQSPGTRFQLSGIDDLFRDGLVVPAHAILFTPSTSCPTGYAEYTTLRGRYVVGLGATGTSAATVGTALTDRENRAVGRHAHTQASHGHGVTDPGHTHGIDNSSSTDGGDGNGPRTGNHMNVQSSSSTTGLSIDATTPRISNQGDVAGTNAPYVQLLACQKQ